MGGPFRFPRHWVHRGLLGGLHADGHPIYVLLRTAGWGSWRAITEPVKATPLTLSRLACLAALVGYDGPLLGEEVPAPPSGRWNRDAFGPTNIPRPPEAEP